MSIGKIGPISVVTIPATTNPPCRTTNAAEEVGSEAGRVWIELMLKAFCRNACLWPLRGQARASARGKANGYSTDDGYSRIGNERALSSTLRNVPADRDVPFHGQLFKTGSSGAELLHRDAIVCARPTIFLRPEKCEDDLAPGRKGSRGQIERVDSQPGIASIGVHGTLPAIQGPVHHGG